MIAINLRGVWNCMKYELRQMREQGSGAIDPPPSDRSSVNDRDAGRGRTSTMGRQQHGAEQIITKPFRSEPQVAAWSLPHQRHPGGSCHNQRTPDRAGSGDEVATARGIEAKTRKPGGSCPGRTSPCDGAGNGRLHLLEARRGVPLNATEAERKTFEAGHESMQKGWAGTLDQLTAYLAQA